MIFEGKQHPKNIWFHGFWNNHWLLFLTHLYTLHTNCPCIQFLSDKVLWSIFWFGFWRTYMHSQLIMTEMVMFKIVYIFKYSRIAAMNEYFLTRFITSFNFVVIFGFTIIRIVLQEHTGTRRYFHQFAKPYEVYKKVEIP